MPIREFLPSDLTAVLEIYALSKLDEFANEPIRPSLVPLAHDKARWQQFSSSTVYVYEEGGVRGYGGHAGNEITALFVHPDARGHGVGLALLRCLVAKIPGDCYLSVAMSNVRAIELYRGLGFAASESFVGVYNGVAISGLVMNRAKPPSSSAT